MSLDILETKELMKVGRTQKTESTVNEADALAPTKKAYDAVKTAIAATHEAQNFADDELLAKLREVDSLLGKAQMALNDCSRIILRPKR